MDLYRPGDLKATYGRGFSARNLHQMRSFYLAWEILQTLSAKSGSPGAADYCVSSR